VYDASGRDVMTLDTFARKAETSPLA